MSIPLMESKQAAQFVHGLIEASFDPAISVSTKGKITDANEAAARITGVPREKILSSDLYPYFADLENIIQAFNLALLKGSITDYPLTIRHISGKLIHLSCNATVYRDLDGKAIGIFAIAHDITALKQAVFYARNLVETSLDPLVTISATGKITDVNESTIKVTGIPREQIIGTDFCDYFTEPDKAQAGYREVFAVGVITDYPLTIRHISGKLTPVLYNATVHRDENANVIGMFAAARDVTERMQLEKQLRRQNKCWEALNRVYRQALTCQTEMQLGMTCLSVAEWLTGSKFGYIGELNAEGLQDIIAISNPGWEACNVPEGQATVSIKNMPLRGIDRTILIDGKAKIVNGAEAIATHADHFAQPSGHPPLLAFLGVPLKESGKTVGLIALANKDGGYTSADLENVERLAVAVMEAFSRKRAELAVQHLNANIENLVHIRTEQLNNSKSWATVQYQVVRALAENNTWHDALQNILESIITNVAKNRGRNWGAFWRYSNESKLLSCSEHIHLSGAELDPFTELSRSLSFGYGEGIPGKVWKSMKATIFNKVADICNCQRHNDTTDLGLKSGVAFPVYDQDEFFGVFEFLTEVIAEWDVDALEALGQQIGQFASRKEVESERERLASVVEQSSDAIFTISSGNLISSWNKGAEQMLGFKSGEILGKEISLLLGGSKDQDLSRIVLTSLQAGRRVDGYETSLVSRSGKNIDVLLFGVPWHTNSGEYAGGSLTLHNITEKKEAERKVSEFYSVVSHELRTPLTSIRGVLGLIESRTVHPDSAEAAELIEVARTSSDRLIRLINDMLDLKKIEAGKMSLKKSRLDIQEVVSASINSISGMANDAGISLVNEPGTEGFIYADRDKTIQIITNLVSNAIKFSPPQGRVRIITEPSGQNRVRFRILDNGPGIADHNLVRLFDKFQQVDSSDTRPVGGTGLGLAITKALVEEHGGKIGVKSRVAVGSEFWFELPACLEKPDVSGSQRTPDGWQLDGSKATDSGTFLHPIASANTGKSDEPLPEKQRKGKILVVDDDEELRRVVSAQIKSKGLECIEAGNGQDAINLIRSHSPDLIILDVIMPEMDGFAVVDFLKGEEIRRRIPVVVYSCKDLSHNERELMELKVIRYLVKGEASHTDLADTVVELLQEMQMSLQPQPE